jgi:hypothetical protein
VSDTTPCYVAKKPCGHYVYAAVVVTDHKFMSSVFRELTKMANAGGTIELRDVQFARENLFRCNCKKEPADAANPNPQ